MLSVPSGIARELAEAALELRQEGIEAAWFAMDVDPQPLALTETLLRERALEGFTLLRGDALDRAFLTDMIPHHMGAVMMSQQLLGQGLAAHTELEPFARTVRDAQHAEIERAVAASTP